MATISNLFTIEEASQHSTKDDCWVVIDGKVYDVSSYMDDHPGGEDVLLAATGKDAKEEFEDAGHGKSARELMKDYCIGELDSCSPVIPELEIVSKKGSSNNVQKLKNLTKQYWAVPVAVLSISVVVGFLYLRKK